MRLKGIFLAEAAAGAIGLLVIVGGTILALILATQACHAHEAPSGLFVYPSGCCHAAGPGGFGDCAPIPSLSVTAKPDGYHVTLGVGQHPKLVTKGYSAVIPYANARHSEDGSYHICLATDGASRFCFFAPPPGV